MSQQTAGNDIQSSSVLTYAWAIEISPKQGIVADIFAASNALTLNGTIPICEGNEAPATLRVGSLRAT